MSITLTGVRCGNCGASLAPQVPDTWHEGDEHVEKCYACGHEQRIVHGGAREPPPARPDVLGSALSECSAAFDGVSSHGRAREVIEVLRRGRLVIDPLTRAALERVMGRAD